MTITKYEIDMLNVGAADAFLIHFFDDDNNYEFVVLIDGGNYSDGVEIAKFIKTHYKQNYINLAICTHCDKDHFGGLIYLLEQQRDKGKDNMNIQEIWLNDPADHVELGQVKWIRKESTLVVKARSVYDNKGKNLIDVLENVIRKDDGIKWLEPFSDADSFDGKPYISSKWNGTIEVLGPSVKYYESLVPDFRNDLKRTNYETDESSEQESEYKDGKVHNQTIEDAKDDPSSHNQSSVVIKFTPSNGKTYLFTGDAGREAMTHIMQRDVNKIKNINWLKVPHHGSKYNMSNDIINHLNPKVAYISTEKYGHYMSKAVVNVLNKLGCKVYTTNINGSMCHHHNTKNHEGYSTATPVK